MTCNCRLRQSLQKKNKLWKLKKTVYGLADASLNWSERLEEVFIVLRGTACKFDAGLFVFRDLRSKIGLVSIHVDDFFWARNQNFISSVVAGIRSNFQIGSEKTLPF